MKNKGVLFGCLGAVVVVMVAVPICAYFFLYRPAKAYVMSFAKWKEVPALNAQVSNKSSFTPPPNGELTADQVKRVLSVQQGMREALGPKIQELNAKYKAIEAKHGSKGDPSIGEMMMALKDLTNLYLDAKRAQISALNAQGFSLPEYEWTRASMYAASGIPVDFRIERAIHDIASGKEPDFDSAKNPTVATVPDKNRELVAPHQKQLADLAGLAFFGL